MSGKPTTPIQSPTTKVVKMETPSTPPSSRPKSKRLSTSYLETPEQQIDILPFSPSRKRSSVYKSPDYKLNSHNVQSPYNASNLLKTPRHSSYDDGDGSGDVQQHNKMQKTPQYFSPGKRLFAEDISNREDLSEISLQLKSKLSSALGKLQQSQSYNKSLSSSKVIGDLTTSSATAAASRTAAAATSTGAGSGAAAVPASPYNQNHLQYSHQRANLNLQTLQQSPIPYTPASPPKLYTMQTSTLTAPSSHQKLQQLQQQSTPKQPHSPTKQTQTNLSNSPSFERINIPSPDEETSAHNALMAALTRQKRRSRGSFSNNSPIKPRRNSITNSSQFTPRQSQPQVHEQHLDQSYKLPPINMTLNTDLKNSGKPSGPGGKENPNNEQDAVLSLMSLSSPQSVKFGHSRTHSLNTTGSPRSSRASSVASPNVAQPVISLPPISGLIHQASSQYSKPGEDNDETDVENDDDATDNDDD